MSKFYMQGARRGASSFLTPLAQLGARFRKGGNECERAFAIFDSEKVSIYLGHDWAVEGSGDPEMDRLCVEYASVAKEALRLRLPAKTRIEWLEAAALAAKRLNDVTAEAEALIEAGRSRCDISDFDQARLSLERAQRLALKLQDRRHEVAYLNTWALLLLSTGRNREAIEQCEQGIEIAELVGDASLLAEANNHIGLAYHFLQQNADALRHFDRALALAGSTGDRVMEATVLNNIGMAHPGDPVIAIEHYERALELACLYGNVNSEGNVRMNIGMARRTAGEPQRAIAALMAALPLFRRNGNRRNESKTINELGRAHMDLSQYSEALTCFTDARRIAEAIHDTALEGCAVSNIGWAYAGMGKPTEAITFYKTAITILRSSETTENLQIALFNLGDAYGAMEMWQAAIDECYLELLTIGRAIDDSRLSAKAFYWLGRMHQRLKEYHQAIAYFDLEITILRELKDVVGEGWTLDLKGDCYRELHSSKQALECYESAQHCGLAAEEKSLIATASHDLGNLHRSEGRLHEAIRAYEAAIEGNPNDAWIHHNLAVTWQMTRDHRKAIDYLRKAIKLSPEVSSRCALIGSLLQCGEHEKAQHEISLIYPHLEQEGIYSQACFAAVIGDRSQAMRLLTEALEEGKLDDQWVRIDPNWQTFHGDEQFLEIVNRRQTHGEGLP